MLLIAPVAAFAQDKPPAAATASQDSPFSGHNKFVFSYVKMILLSSAEKMPEESYSFKPTEAVRSYGQIVGHIADSQYYFCSLALGEKNPALNIEKTKTSRADLIAGIREACAYCERRIRA